MRITRPLVVMVLTVALSVGAGSCSALSPGGGNTSAPQVEQSSLATPKPSSPKPSASSQQTIVPDVIGMNAEQATEAIELMGLEVDLDAGRLVIIKSNWTVTGTDPAPETMVDFGSTVIVTVEKLPDDADDTETLRVTDEGLTQGMAVTVCTRAGKEDFPGGFDVKGFGGGHIEVSHESIYLDVDVEITTADGTTRTTKMECTVSGTDDRPKLNDFLVY